MDGIDQLQYTGLTVGKSSLKLILENETQIYDAVPALLKEAVKAGTPVNLAAVEKLPHLHLGESNFKTRIVKNGESCTRFISILLRQHFTI